MRFSAHPGLPLIETISVESVKRFGPEVVKKLLMTGGMYAMHIPRGGVMNLPLAVVQLTKPAELECLTQLEGTSVIHVVKEYADRLSQKDMDALLLHEYGHIRHGHEMPANVAGKTLVNGILIDVKAELQADAYAASKVGKRNMAIALTHAVEVMAEIISTKIGTIPRRQDVHQKAISAFMMEPQFRTRIAALQ